MPGPTLEDQFWADARAADERDRERRRQARAATSIAQPSDPKRVAQANRLAREVGQPAAVVEAQFDQMSQYRRAKAAREAAAAHPRLGEWLGDERNAALAQDDVGVLAKIGDAVTSFLQSGGINASRAMVDNARSGRFRRDAAQDDGFFDRAGSLLERGAASVDQGLYNFIAGTTGSSRARQAARDIRGTTDASVAGQRSWEAVKSRPTLGNIGGFVLDAGIESIPGMATAAVPYVGLAALGASQTGNIAAQRAENDGRGEVTGGDVAVAAPFGFGAAALERIGLKGIFGAPGATVRGRIAQAAATEGTTEFAQGSLEYTGGSAGTRQGFDLATMFDQGLSGAVAGAGIGGGLRSAVEVATSERSIAAINRLMGEAEGSQVRQNDPESFRVLLEQLTGGETDGNLYISGEVIAAFNQDYSNDEFWSRYSDDIDDALLTGGDVAIPVADAAAFLPGTPDWDAIQNDVRAAPGGMTANEITEAEAEWETQRREASAALDESERAARRDAAPAERLRRSIRDRLMNAGMDPDAAVANAEVTAALFETEAANLGRTVTGREFEDAVQVQRVLPEMMAAPEAADTLDIIVNAMRNGGDPAIGAGPTLFEFIRKRGGINDPGGDLAAMGVPKRLLRDSNPDQGALGGISGEGDFGQDTTLRAAIEYGFFPELAQVENETGPSTLDTQVLLDALGRESGGQPVYAETREDQMRAAASELRDLLQAAGVDPDSADMAAIREAVDRFEAGQVFDQREDGPQGQILFSDAGAVVKLFETANASTFQHEMAHFWLERFKTNALATVEGDGNAGARSTFADWETLKAWFASEGHSVEGGTIPEGAHELFARGWERYLMEGKAPSTALQSAFRKFARWMKMIYRTVAGLNAPISPDVREVMDRMLATDEMIALAQEERAAALQFDDALEAGMSETDARRYAALGDEARSTAEEELYGKVMRSIRAREQKQWRKQERAVREEVVASVDARPGFAAMKALREKGGPRLDRRWLAEEYGEDVFGILPAGVPVWTDGGVNADALAEQFGFTSGDQLVRELIGMEQARREMKDSGDKRSLRARTIDEEVRAEMHARFGDPFSDGTIEREAEATIQNDRMGEKLELELRALGSKTKRKPTPYAMARRWARDRIEQSVVADSVSGAAQHRYSRTAAKASRDALKATMAGDFEAAFRHKQTEMLHNALAREAAEASERVDVIVRRLGKYARRRNLPSMDQDYLEQIHSFLEAVEFRRVSQSSIDRRGRWAEWATERQAEGQEVILPAGYEAQLGRTNWSRMTVEGLYELDEGVKNIAHLGRLKKKLLDGKEQREFDEVVREAEAAADQIGRKPPKESFTEPSRWDSVRSRAASLDASLLKMEQVFDWLDQGNSNGVFNRFVFRPMADAQAREQDMVADYFQRISEAVQRVPKEQVKRWENRITLRLIDPETGAPAVMTRQKIVSMALNWGNDGNRQRLVEGYGWSYDLVEQTLMEVLTEQEWQFVQEVWDIVDTLWPELSAMERRVSGVAPEKVEAVAVATPHGEFRGGYYPAIYDTVLDRKSKARAGLREDLLEANYVRATTRSSASKDRAEAVRRPILLDLGVINRHLGEVIHDVTHREAILQAHKFLTNERVARAVDETLGPEVTDQFRPWLKHIANSWAQERAGNEGVGRFLTKARANTTVVGMGWRFTTILTQVAGYSNSFEKVGVKHVAAAIAQTAAHPIETFDFVMTRSDEMRNRMDTIDRDVRLAIRQMAGDNGAITAAKRFAFHGIGYMDRAVSVPTWLGAYNKAIAQGMSEADASYAGDKAVRLSQGAGGAKDLAGVATGQGRYGEALKLMTMFYSYLSTVYARQRNLGRDMVRASWSDMPDLIARAWWLVVVPPLLAEILSGRGPEEEEDWGLWAFGNMLSQSLGAIPGVRDVTPSVYAKLSDQGFAFAPRLSPIEGAYDSVVRMADDAGRIARGEDTRRATRNALETVGYTTGLVPGQVAASTQFLVDIGYGEQDPETAAEFWQGISKGKIAEE